jgi:hypothetical protein
MSATWINLLLNLLLLLFYSGLTTGQQIPLHERPLRHFLCFNPQQNLTKERNCLNYLELLKVEVQGMLETT